MILVYVQASDHLYQHFGGGPYPLGIASLFPVTFWPLGFRPGGCGPFRRAWGKFAASPGRIIDVAVVATERSDTMATIKLAAESKFGYSGQYIARITGRATKFQFVREFVGNKFGKRHECTSYETDEIGLYEECDVDKHGKKKSYAIVMLWKEDLRKLYSDTEDALKIAKRLDGGETIEQIVSLELEPMNESKYVPTCSVCRRTTDLVNGQCPDHVDAQMVSAAIDVPKLKDDGTRAHRLIYTIRSPGESKKAEAAGNVDAAVDAIVQALQALPDKLQKQALKLAKDRLFPPEVKVSVDNQLDNHVA